MFTGIVQAVARIGALADNNGIRTFAIEFPASFLEGLTVGGSVSVDGVCLTATAFTSPTTALFEVILQSLLVTTLADCTVGDGVNVERAARDGGEIGGHPLSGHIDFSAEIESVREIRGSKVLRLAVPEAHRRYVFAKGYIALNGASLTVSECSREDGWFEVWLIPETRRATTLDAKKAGDRINIEIDRGTQVLVDTVRDTVSEALGKLRPELEAILSERGVPLEDLIVPALAPPRLR